MSTLRVSNIEAKADASSPTIDEKVKITSSDGRVLVQVDGKTAGITSIGINTTGTSFTIDANQNVQFVGVITAANVNTTGVSTFTSLNVGTGGTIITTTGIGSVGIGTINPQYKFHLGGSSPHAFIQGNYNSTAPVDHSRIYFNDYNFGIGCGNFGSVTDDDLYLWAFNGTGRDIKFCSTTDGSSAVNSGSWTTNMIIKNDGKTGIGTTNPQAKLHIHGGDAYLSFDRGLYFARENANTEWSNYIKATNNPDGGYSSTTEHNYWVEIASKGGTHIVLNNDGTRDAARNIHDHFTIWQKDSDSTNGARVFAVDNYGNVQFGNAGVRLDRAWDNNPCITVQRDNTWGTSNASSEFRIHGIGWTHAEWVGGGSGADFSVNLRVDGGNYYGSDRRHKTNIVDNPYGLDAILQLQPRKFNRINSSGEIEENQGDILGFIAQEVIEVIPEAVNYYPDEDVPNENGFCRAYALSDSYIVSTLVNAVKEQNAIIESLKSRIEVLESQINT